MVVLNQDHEELNIKSVAKLLLIILSSFFTYFFGWAPGIKYLPFCQCNMQEGMEGNPIAGTMKNFSRILAVVAVPVMMSFPKVLDVN